MLLTKDIFISTVEKIVKRKEKITLKLDQGWYSEPELRDELHWPAPLFLIFDACAHVSVCVRCLGSVAGTPALDGYTHRSA